jgi:hypothetical protein
VSRLNPDHFPIVLGLVLVVFGVTQTLQVVQGELSLLTAVLQFAGGSVFVAFIMALLFF